MRRDQPTASGLEGTERLRACRLLIALVALIPVIANASEQPVPKLFAYCVGVAVPGQKPLPFAGQAKLLRELGYTGIGCELAGVETHLKLFDDAGIALDMVWTTIDLKHQLDPQLPAAIRKLKGRSTVVCVLLNGFKPEDPHGMEPAIKALRELGDVAAEAGVRISIYNHVGNWTERLPFIIEVVRQTDHPQVGFNFNLCHWLKVSGPEGYRPLLRANAGKLFAVTINGATVGAKNWTNGLIRPLDEGDFDHRQLLATLREIGYRGPVGLMCYGVPGDARDHLARSMTTWRRLTEHSDKK
jgi:sugar phosphate isomerase/epimerase